MEYPNQIDQKIESYRADMVELQRLLTAIPALAPENGGQGEMEKATMLKSYLESMGFDDVQLYNAPDSRVSCGFRPNLVLTVKGQKSDRKVCILSHTDIVPPGDRSKWSHDPYSLKVDGDILTGRGVEDNQHGLVTSVFALKAVVECGADIPGDVRLFFVADEETGFTFGLDWLLENHKELFSENDLFLVPDFGCSSGKAIEIAEKSVLWIKFTVFGKQAHASKPSAGNNAHRAGANLLVRLDQELHRKFSAENPLFVPSTSTFEPTKKLSNVPNFNTIPPEDIFCFDCRILPEYSLDEVKQAISGIVRSIEGQFKVSVSIDFEQCEQAAPPTSENDDIVRMLKRSIEEVYRVEACPVGIGGGTVASSIRRKGIPAAAWSRVMETAHQSDESCRISDMIGDAKVMARLIMQI